MTKVTRRKFIKGFLATTGVLAAGLLSYMHGFGRTKTSIADPGNPTGSTRNNRNVRREPGYLALERSGELARREQILWKKMERCDLCPRLCHVNRMAGEIGYCGVADTFRVASWGPDFGNERPIHGTRGSGSIFLSNCPLLCIFCQNWEINHRGDGRPTSPAQLADMLLEMQNRRRTHNVSFITPTHLVPHLVSALRIAIAGGLNVPLCYNTSGYESLEVVKLLDGVVDIYQPDFKFQDSAIAARFTQGAPDYQKHTAAAIKEMYRQVGPLNSVDGLATHGVVVRHLVLPENQGGADKLARWIVEELGTDAHVNIMGQFWPAFRSNEFPPLNRRTTRAEYQQAVRWAREAGIRNFH